MNPEHPKAPAGLRRHFAQHNRRVWLLLAFSLCALAILWAGLYAAAYWLTLLALSVSGGIDAGIPQSFSTRFILVAALLCVAAFFADALFRKPRLKDRNTPTGVLWDFLLAVPRATLSLPNTMRAFHRLDARELGVAWELLQVIEQQRRLEWAKVPLHVPDRTLGEKLILNLQLVGLVDVRRAETGLYLALRDGKARALCRNFVRIRA